MADIYDAIESQTNTLILALTRYTGHSEYVSRGNYRILDTGIPEAVVLTAGAVGIETQEAYGVYRTCDVLIDMFARYGDSESTAHALLRAMRADILTMAEIYPTLNHLSGVIQTEIQSDGDPADLFDKQGGGPYFIWQTLRLSVTRRYTLTGGEY